MEDYDIVGAPSSSTMTCLSPLYSITVLLRYSAHWRPSRINHTGRSLPNHVKRLPGSAEDCFVALITAVSSEAHHVRGFRIQYHGHGPIFEACGMSRPRWHLRDTSYGHIMRTSPSNMRRLGGRNKSHGLRHLLLHLLVARIHSP